MLVLWSSSRLQLRRQNGRTERAPFYNWRSLILVFGAPGFYNRHLPFQVLSAFMIHYVQLALSDVCAPFEDEALLCWTFFSADSTLIATL